MASFKTHHSNSLPKIVVRVSVCASLLLLQVKAAMNDINAAQRLRVAAADKAEAAKIKVSNAPHLLWLCSA